jgi:hypothetical protein
LSVEGDLAGEVDPQVDITLVDMTEIDVGVLELAMESKPVEVTRHREVISLPNHLTGGAFDVVPHGSRTETQARDRRIQPELHTHGVVDFAGGVGARQEIPLNELPVAVVKIRIEPPFSSHREFVGQDDSVDRF